MAGIPVAPGTNSPLEDDLRTGDLLFPRVPTPEQTEELFVVPFLLEGDQLLGDVIGARPWDGERARGRPGYEIVHFDEQPRLWIESVNSDGAFDPNKPGDLMLLLKILDATFGELTREWLNMTVREFIKHPIARILIDAINKDKGSGFFIGHCALVLREKAGHNADDGRVYVMEANITDYSHYRVSIHPYGATTKEVPVRGWVNYRCGLGQQVWHARPTVLDRDSAATAATRDAIVQQARTFLGRPYGFFDSPFLGDSDRLYCSEFVFETFTQAGGAASQLDVDDHRSWRWLLDNMPLAERAKLIADLKSGDGHLYAWVINRPFFLLTVQMLWRSARLTKKLLPGGREYA